ncbi:hypothetical protein, partial [Planomonospora algeriensis]
MADSPSRVAVRTTQSPWRTGRSPRLPATTRVSSVSAYTCSKPSALRTASESSATAVTCPVWAKTVVNTHGSSVPTRNSPCIAPANSSGCTAGSAGTVAGAGRQGGPGGRSG